MSYLDEEVDNEPNVDEQEAPVINTSDAYVPSVDLGSPQVLDNTVQNQPPIDRSNADPYSPLLQYLDKIKPQPNTEDEERQRRLAKYNALGQALSLVANGVGVANGATPIPNSNKIGIDAYNRYLNDRAKYKAETDAWQKDYLRTLALSAQSKIKSDENVRKDNNWYKQKAVEYAQQAKMYGLKKDDTFNNMMIRLKNANNLKDKEIAARALEGKLNRAAADKRHKETLATKKPYASPFEVRVNNKKIGLSKTDADQIYQRAVQDPDIQAKYPALIATAFDAPGARKDKIMGLLNSPEVISKYSQDMASVDEYGQGQATSGESDMEELGNPPSDEATIERIKDENDKIASDPSLNKATKRARMFKSLTKAGYPKTTAQSIIDAYQLK